MSVPVARYKIQASLGDKEWESWRVGARGRVGGGGVQFLYSLVLFLSWRPRSSLDSQKSILCI